MTEVSKIEGTAPEGFYRAFEERHRGPREVIRKRLEVYLPFILPLRDLYDPAGTIDVGCGRGEWLELLQTHGFAPKGIDLDAGMLAACTERGLDVIQGDAIAHLKSLPDASQAVVSGFHVAEHIPFDDLLTLVAEALRVLQPAGLLILETPNPENLSVGANSFYLDPTHIRPIPPLLLEFVPKYHGFVRVRTLRLQENPEIHTQGAVTLMDVVDGVSPDYAIMAQKGAAPEVMRSFDHCFSHAHGITLHELASRYDARWQASDQRWQAVDQKQQANDRQWEANDQRWQMNGQQWRANDEHWQTNDQKWHISVRRWQANDQRWQANDGSLEALAEHVRKLEAQFAARLIDAEVQRNALLNSLSWRISAPLRAVGASFVAHPPRASATVSMKRPRRIARALDTLGGWAERTPWARNVSLRILDRFPGLALRIRRARASVLVHEAALDAQAPDTQGATAALGAHPPGAPGVQPSPPSVNAALRTPLEVYLQADRGES